MKRLALARTKLIIRHNVQYVSTQYSHTNVLQRQLINGSVLQKLQLIFSDNNETKQIISQPASMLYDPQHAIQATLGDFMHWHYFWQVTPLLINQINNTNI